MCAGYGKAKESECKCGALWSPAEFGKLFDVEVPPLVMVLYDQNGVYIVDTYFMVSIRERNVKTIVQVTRKVMR